VLTNFENSSSFHGFEIEKELCRQYIITFLTNIAQLQGSKPNVDAYKDKLREAFL
jgi:hypothetical protein